MVPCLRTGRACRAESHAQLRTDTSRAGDTDLARADGHSRRHALQSLELIETRLADGDCGRMCIERKLLDVLMRERRLRIDGTAERDPFPLWNSYVRLAQFETPADLVFVLICLSRHVRHRENRSTGTPHDPHAPADRQRSHIAFRYRL